MKLWIILLVGGLTGGMGAQAADKPSLVLMVSKYDQPGRDLAAMTLGWMCKEAGVEFDVYYAADHKEGGLFSAHGSSVIGGHHAARIGRVLSSFKTTVVRLGDVKVFDTLFRGGAHKVINAPGELLDLYERMSRELGLMQPVTDATAFASTNALPAFYPEVVYRRAWAVGIDVKVDRLREMRVKTVWTVAPANADLSSFKGLEVKVAQDLSVADPVLELAQRWISRSSAVDPLEPLVASYQLPMSIRDARLMLTYKDRKDGERRRDQMLKLIDGKNQSVAYGRWFGDPQLIPYANLPLAYNVTEPNRNIVSVFSRYPQQLPQPAKSWIDLEPSDDQLSAWAKEGKVLSTWVLHSGELSHNDAVLGFMDWSAMTKMKIGSGVHWQRYHFDPDAVESMHIPIDEGGTLGLVEPVLHSAGAGIIWETSGNPTKIAAMMADSRKKVAAVAGERFAPRGVYCFADHGKHDKSAKEPGAAEVALYKAVKEAGFDYLITSILPGESRILYRDGDFVVLNQAAKWESASPFVRGTPATFAAVEKKLADAGKPGWLVGAIDSPIHGSPIYMGRPYGGKNPHPRINEFYDYVQNKGVTGKVISATPRTIARYARICADLEKAPPVEAKPRAVVPVRQGALVPINPDLVLLDAEAFAQYGGWVLDQQFMDVMGSPFLLAHGLGKPVAPAATKVMFKAGTYHVKVRTRDWVAPKGPGQFKVSINGKPIDKTFGVGGDGTWQWHDGGPVDVAEGEVEVGLLDLTGFDGRVDAILFARAGDFVPPNTGAEMTTFRKKALGLPDAPVDEGEFDLVVVGGGYAGTCASIAAARLGLKVALIQDRSILGGNASSEVRVGPIGKMNLPPFPRNADILKEILAAPEAQQATGGFRMRPDDDWTLKIARAEKNLSIFLEHRGIGVEKKGDRIAAVIARHVRSGVEKRFRGTFFADCTGDACIGFLAGAHWKMGREARSEYGESFAPEKADSQILGMTQMWTARKTDQPSTFPACPWALNITEESAEISRPKYPPEFRHFAYIGGWNWESGFDKDPIGQGEEVRDYNLRAIYGTWDYYKNKSFEKGAYANAELEWVAHILGKRESRRLMGDHVLTQQDVVETRIYPDGVVTATWYLDLHFPHPESEKHFPGGAYRSIAYDDPQFKKLMPDVPGVYTPIKPYPIPFRCFYSRNVPNLFMAGRNISATHVGLAPVRVQNTTGAMGAMVGRAAYLCKMLNVEPRRLHEKHMEDLKSLLTDPKPR